MATKELPPIKPTQQVAYEFNREVRALLTQMRRDVLEAYRQAPTPEAFLAYLNRLDLAADEEFIRRLESRARRAMGDINQWHADRFYTTFARSVGVGVNRFVNEQGLEDVLEGMAAATAKRATDEVFQGQIERLQSVVYNSIVAQTGKTIHLEREIAETFGVARNKAKFVARDQTQRVVNGLNKFRQKAAGIEEYKWLTSKDSRVRDKPGENHRVMNGLIVNWDTGRIKATAEAKRRGVAGKTVQTVAGGHVGETYNCRCTARAIIEE